MDKYSGRFGRISEDHGDNAYTVEYMSNDFQLIDPPEEAIWLEEDIDPYADPVVDYLLDRR